LFPFCVKRLTYDPTRPASRFFLRKSWERLRKLTGFLDLNPHDLRHHFITRMLEAGVDPETVRAIAGHVRKEMTLYYAHHRTRVIYDAVMAIDKPPPKSPQAVKAQSQPEDSAPQSSTERRHYR
jgi:integrase